MKQQSHFLHSFHSLFCSFANLILLHFDRKMFSLSLSFDAALLYELPKKSSNQISLSVKSEWRCLALKFEITLVLVKNDLLTVLKSMNTLAKKQWHFRSYPGSLFKLLIFFCLFSYITILSFIFEFIIWSWNILDFVLISWLFTLFFLSSQQFSWSSLL